MYIKQIYTSCLAQASYYIESNGEAAIVDPIREPQPYTELAAVRGANIKYVLETHFHADFVSGHKELADVTGATIVYGPEAKANYPITNVSDGDVLEIGNVKIKPMHTPGHTPESVCYIITDEDGNDTAIFTGDTLFVGDVGRPDLLDGVIISKEEQLSALYNTLNNKIKKLPDNLIVYPGHGPGSMCGKSIGKETESTIGKEKATNYALQDMDFATFTHTILNGQLKAPAYFVKNAIINREGYQPIETVLKQANNGLTTEQLLFEVSNKGAQILDTRNQDTFLKSFITGSINVALEGSFAIWVGTVVDINQPLIVITEPGKNTEAIIRLARIGFENIIGVYNIPADNWADEGLPLSSIENIDPADLQTWLENNNGRILDVRRADEYNNAHFAGARLMPLRSIPDNIESIQQPENPTVVHCAGGYRSVIALSLLSKAGIKNLVNLQGGFEKAKAVNTQLIESEVGV